jgi:hypothetical protein
VAFLKLSAIHLVGNSPWGPGLRRRLLCLSEEDEEELASLRPATDTRSGSYFWERGGARGR